MNKKHALVVGNSEYANNEYFESLPFCVNDAEIVYNRLCCQETSIFCKDTSIIIHNATLINFISSIDKFCNNIKPNELVLIYFAGHGISLKGSSYHLVMTDTLANSKSVALSSFNIDMLIPVFREKNINSYIVILDSCRSAKALQSVGIRARSFDESEFSEINRDLVGEGKIVIASSQGFQDAIEDEELQHGVFSYYFLEALDSSGKDGKKEFLSINDIYRHVCEAMGRHSSYTQKPEMSGVNINGEILISKNPHYKPWNDTKHDSSDKKDRFDYFKQLIPPFNDERKQKLKGLKPFTSNEIDSLLEVTFVEIEDLSSQRHFHLDLGRLMEIFTLIRYESFQPYQVDSLIKIIKELSELNYYGVEMTYPSSCPAFNEIALVLKDQKLTVEQKAKANKNFHSLSKFSASFQAHVYFDREGSGIDYVDISFKWLFSWNSNLYYTPNRITICIYDANGMEEVYLSGKDRNDTVSARVKKGNVRIRIRPPWKKLENYYDVDQSFIINQSDFWFYLSRGLFGGFELSRNFDYK